MKTVEAGMRVRTKWDDEPKYANAKVLRRYRGHRAVKLLVRMEDTGAEEVITEDQIVKIL